MRIGGVEDIIACRELMQWQILQSLRQENCVYFFYCSCAVAETDAQFVATSYLSIACANDRLF